MVEFEDFFIPHIGKTGGDAIKSISKEVGLPIVDIKEDMKKGKHVSPRYLFGKKDMVLSIRRLPFREISKVNQLVYADKVITWDEIGDPAKWILRELQAEREIKNNTDNGNMSVKMFIRSEYLRDDLEKVFSSYYDLSDEQRKIIRTTETKKRLNYCRDIFYWFTPDQIKQLYDQSPVWSKYEKMAYDTWSTKLYL